MSANKAKRKERTFDGSKTLARAKWLAEEAEVTWAVATDEEGRLIARRMFECVEELRQYHKLLTHTIHAKRGKNK